MEVAVVNTFAEQLNLIEKIYPTLKPFDNKLIDRKDLVKWNCYKSIRLHKKFEMIVLALSKFHNFIIIPVLEQTSIVSRMKEAKMKESLTRISNSVANERGKNYRIFN